MPRATIGETRYLSMGDAQLPLDCANAAWPATQQALMTSRSRIFQCFGENRMEDF
jgi:hypothetical protein